MLVDTTTGHVDMLVDTTTDMLVDTTTGHVDKHADMLMDTQSELLDRPCHNHGRGMRTQ